MNLFKKNETPANIVDYYEDLYKDRIRKVDENWILAQEGKYRNCPGYMQSLALNSKTIFNSYSPGKGLESKRTFVLWKMNSICECLGHYGFGCQHKNCKMCPVHCNAEKQLNEIDMEIDEPSGGRNIRADAYKDRVVFDYKGHHIEVYISDTVKEGGDE